MTGLDLDVMGDGQIITRFTQIGEERKLNLQHVWRIFDYIFKSRESCRQ